MTEIRLHKGLHHPNIVKFEHVFEDQDNVYIMLELCQNQSVNELLKRRKKLTEFEVQCYVIQIVDALKYLHANRIIHRDLKLGNMFLNEKMQIKLGDFGLAAKLEFDGEKKRTVCGTPNYIAPEILDGNIGHSYQVDVWSLGVIIYTLLIGKPPFETTEIKLTYKRIKENNYSFPDNATISDNAKDIIKKILITQPEQRLTLDEILLHPFIDNAGPLPKLLPISTLACPPTPSYIKQFASTSTSQRIRISTEPEDFMFQDGVKSVKASTTHTTRFNTVQSKTPSASNTQGFDFFRATPKTPKLDFFGADRFNTNTLMSTVGNDKGKQIQMPHSPKTPNSKPLISMGNIQEEQEEKSPEIKKADELQNLLSDPVKDIRVIKWYDYSTKYGLGYALSNSAIGVFFNDGTKLIAPPGETFTYIKRSADKQDIETVYNFNDYPQDVHKKVLVYNRFKEHFEPTIKKLPKVTGEEDQGLVYIKKWIKTKNAVFFRMNNRSLQVVFKDDSVLIMNSTNKKLHFIDSKGNHHTCDLHHAASSPNTDLVKRVKYTEEVLKHIWTAQTDKHEDEKPNENMNIEKPQDEKLDPEIQQETVDS